MAQAMCSRVRQYPRREKILCIIRINIIFRIILVLSALLDNTYGSHDQRPRDLEAALRLDCLGEWGWGWKEGMADGGGDLELGRALVVGDAVFDHACSAMRPVCAFWRDGPRVGRSRPRSSLGLRERIFSSRRGSRRIMYYTY